MRKYIINDKERFTEMLKKEGMTGDKLKDILRLLSPNLNITVELETIEGVTYQKIIDNVTGNKVNKGNLNGYEKSLISSCFNHYLGFNNKDFLEKQCIEIQ